MAIYRLPSKDHISLRTNLKDIPDAWRIFIEPKIERPSKASEHFPCWLWQGAIGTGGEPVLTMKDAANNMKVVQVAVKVIIAEMFWPGYKRSVHHIYHECGTKNCIHPAHFLVTNVHPSNLTLDKYVKTKRTSIRNYQQQLLRRDEGSE